MKINSYYFSPNGVPGLVKSPAIWVHDEKRNSDYPLIYLRKPKYLPEDVWKDIIKHTNIEINLPQGYEIKRKNEEDKK